MKKLLPSLLVFVLCLTIALPVQAADSKEIVINGGFEQGEEGWGVYDMTTALITVDDTIAHSGENSMYVSEKTASHGGVVQEVTEPLKFYGQGKYRVSAWIRSEDDEDAGTCSITFMLKSTDESSTDNKGANWTLSAQTQLKAGEWVHLTGEMELTWADDLAYGEIYFWFPGDADGSLTNYNVDDITMVKMDYTGSDYVPPTPSPEPTATPAPTATPVVTAAPTAKAAAEATAAPGTTLAPTEKADDEAKAEVSVPWRLVIGLLMSVGGILLGGGGMYLIMKKKQVKQDEK